MNQQAHDNWLERHKDDRPLDLSLPQNWSIRKRYKYTDSMLRLIRKALADREVVRARILRKWLTENIQDEIFIYTVMIGHSLPKRELPI
jgi:hypothetical protein